MTAWKYALKGIFAIILFLALGYLGLLIPFILIVENEAYKIPFVLVAIGVFFVLVVSLLFGRFKTKRHVVNFGAISVVALILTSIIPIWKAYEASIPSVGVVLELGQYEPFSPNAKLARLEHPASLQLQAPLLNLDGATALYPLYAAFAEAVYPEDSYSHYSSSIAVTKTSGAYKRLAKGDADLIFAAAPNAQQRAEAGVELQLTPIGKEAFVFFVNRNNPVDSLTVQQIQEIYAGEIKNWTQVGGMDKSIRAFQRPVGSGSQSALENFMGEKPIEEGSEAEVARTMEGMIIEVEKYRNYSNAIGYSFRYFSTEMVKNGEIKLLKVNGIAPTPATIRSGEYPITVDLFAVTAGTQNPSAQPFIDWILSAEGQELVEKTGYVSLMAP